MSLAFVFPGQGSQSVGMLAELGAAEPMVRDTFAEASEVLGYDLWALCQDGPESDLGATERTQPAMLAAGVATWRVWVQLGGPRPLAMAGHSLGEYTALVCADAMDFRTAIDVVRFRGQVMQQAVPLGQGAMAAILGLEDADLDAACREAAQGEVVEPVNFNAPGQTVIAGNATAVARAIDAAKARGARRAVLLPVSVPSHCDLMRPAAERLAERLAAVPLTLPTVPVLHNVSVTAAADVNALRELLVQQLYRPVRWVETVRAVTAQGVTLALECGPGKVLTGLCKRIDDNLTTLPVFDPKTLDVALEMMAHVEW